MNDVGIVRGQSMAEQVRQVLRVPGIVNGERALDANRRLILGYQQPRADHDQTDENAREDAMVPRPVCPMSLLLRRHVAGGYCNSSAVDNSSETDAAVCSSKIEEARF
jgi:hypothetical protein